MLIQNTPATRQTLTANFGGIRIENRGAGIVSITTGGDQTVTAQFVDVHTAPGSACIRALLAPGTQGLPPPTATGSRTGHSPRVITAARRGTVQTPRPPECAPLSRLPETRCNVSSLHDRPQPGLN